LGHQRAAGCAACSGGRDGAWSTRLLCRLHGPLHELGRCKRRLVPRLELEPVRLWRPRTDRNVGRPADWPRPPAARAPGHARRPEVALTSWNRAGTRAVDHWRMRCPSCGAETPDTEWNCVSCRMNLYWATRHFEDLAQIRKQEGLPETPPTPPFLRQVHKR